MNYELAKKLKDAGFPQPFINDTRPKELYPNLSELIEACGDDLREIVRHSFSHGVKIGHKWSVKSGAKAKRPKMLVNGHTAEEAVAKLWLKLNDNK